MISIDFHPVRLRFDSYGDHVLEELAGTGYVPMSVIDRLDSDEAQAPHRAGVVASWPGQGQEERRWSGCSNDFEDDEVRLHGLEWAIGA